MLGLIKVKQRLALRFHSHAYSINTNHQKVQKILLSAFKLWKRESLRTLNPLLIKEGKKKMIELENYIYIDDNDVILRFKELISPDNEMNFNNKIFNEEFQLIRQYLDNQGYRIAQFPNALHIPNTLHNFAYNQIRSYIQTKRNSLGTVTWDERRILINELNFFNEDFVFQKVPDDLQTVIKKISLRDATWEQQTDDEKLRTIAEVIENLMKLSNGKFLSVDESNFYGLFTEEQLKNFRKQLQVFRHSHKQALEERESEFDESRKKFLIHLGIVILIRLNEITRGEVNG